jgi:N-methylhydantoinase A
MIMRSDGGVMDVAEVARRPILTMLSGPAAGIAGALLHENVTDGIFIEVGGTSADCSVIRRGSPQMRPARVGGHRTMLRTLDVRTLAIAGGSLLRVGAKPGPRRRAARRGPRSAHIAGYGYACFAPPGALEGARVIFVRPQPGDPDDYLALETPAGERFAIDADVRRESARLCRRGRFRARRPRPARSSPSRWRASGSAARAKPRARVLERAADKLRAAIDELIDDYELDRDLVELVGGGGGAAALVPFAAERLGLAPPARARCRGDLAARRGARARARRRRTHHRRADAGRRRGRAARGIRARRGRRRRARVRDGDVEIDARRNLVRATASGATAATARRRPRRGRADSSGARGAANAARASPRSSRSFANAGEFAVFARHACAA